MICRDYSNKKHIEVVIQSTQFFLTLTRFTIYIQIDITLRG